MSTGPATPEPFAHRLLEESRELVDQAAAQGLAVRLMGGIGIRMVLGDRFPERFARAYGDIDVLVGRRDSRGVEELLAARGWDPATAFNALNGSRRLLFHDPASSAQVDVFVEAFEMCHALPLADGLQRPGPTLPATDLLMSKLQIVSLNAKDRGDLYALLAGCDLRDGDHQAIEPDRLAALSSRDWGLHHTFELNLARLREGLAAGEAPPEVGPPIAAIAQAMEDTPKTRAWKLRARIGERKRWYDDPEEVDRTTEAG
ncbi:MAG TPA: hypothetical protein VK501_03790 [Baekduia sp.]|uniref:hypothetical protein n=1 Tax=Baekduia sp. TaxID=2600305 RepID=UPI002C370FCC|nr:hypothetical protein [Baekduia sp.]HMJ33017.1 hypothetical protein [Baekduia sp.]